MQKTTNAFTCGYCVHTFMELQHASELFIKIVDIPNQYTAFDIRFFSLLLLNHHLECDFHAEKNHSMNISQKEKSKNR